MADTAASGVLSGGIKWTGLGSDTDFGSVVNSLVAIEQRTIVRQQTWQSQWQEKLASINQLDQRLVSLKLNAQDYDTRSELLSRAATSSKTDVATITNTSTASTGVYSVEVGADIQEKVASRTFQQGERIGGGILRDADGNYLDAKKYVIGTNDPGEKGLRDALTKSLNDKHGLSITELVYNPGTKSYYDISDQTIGQEVARVVEDTSKTPPEIKIVEVNAGVDGDLMAGLKYDNKGTGRDEFVRPDNGYTIPVDQTVNPADVFEQPIVISMGGKEMTLRYDPSATPGTPGVYSDGFSMEDLMNTINATIADDPDNMPDLKAELVYDKTRGTDKYYRLVLTGNVGGQKNHITVSDPTDLCLDRNAIDDPVTSSWVGTSVKPTVDPSSSYTGHVNKTITVMVSEGNGGYVLGTNNVTFTWADTEGKSGKFTITPSQWDSVNNCLKEPIELLQGVKINLAGAGGANGNAVHKSQAFTIDCQSPVIQKAADIGLAQTDKWVHQGYMDQTSPVTSGQSGKFVYTYAGKEYSVNVPDGLGLSGLVEKINSDSNNPGVMASILNDGMGTATSYKLVLTGYNAGAEYAITISDKTNLNKMPCGPETFEHAREASNSMCRIDGYPNDGVSWIQRQSNEVGDVLDGVVLTLQGIGTTQITIQNNVTEMVDKIKQLVESINFCKTYIKEQTKYGGGKLVSKWNEKTQMFERTTETGKDASGSMIGNYGFQIAQSNIDRLMTKQIFTREEYIKAIDQDNSLQGRYPIKVDDEEKDGPSQEGIYKAYLEKHGLEYTRLIDIGIESDPENSGLYKVNTGELTKALSKNPEAVIKLFTFTPPEDGFPTDRPYVDEPARPRIGGFSVMMGYAMSDITRANDVINDKTGEVIKPAKGITKVLAENYTNIISGIDKKITREEKRIAMVRSRLESKFARLETLLAEMNTQSKRIEAQLDKLNNNK